MIGRREFITLVGSAAAAWPLAAGAQPMMPVVGFLGAGALDNYVLYLAAFRKGLAETGYVEGQNVAIEYRWAEGQYERMAQLAADLVLRRVAVIAVPGSPPGARAAKAATSTIPIVFSVGDDPVRSGLVASISRPGGNATGINFLTGEVVAKRLALLHELLPGATRVTAFINPADASRAEVLREEVEVAARTVGMQLQILNPSTTREIDAAFAALVRERADALFVGPDAFYNSRRVQLANMAARHVVPTAFAVREYVDAGGLMSYGASPADGYRQAGVYVGKILDGANPASLPVLQSDRYELMVNLRTASTLGVKIPQAVLMRADEVLR